MDIGYSRVSTAKQDPDRQIDALRQEGIASKYIYVDKKSGSTTNRPGPHKALDQAREGDVIVVHTLDRLGRTVRDTLNLIHDLQERNVGVRTLADPMPVDSSNPDDPMAQCRGHGQAPLRRAPAQRGLFDEQDRGEDRHLPPRPVETHTANDGEA